MKYIVMRVKNGGSTQTLDLEIPFVFPGIMVHSEMAQRLKPLLVQQYHTVDVEAISAGFINSADFSLSCCHGKSESLGLKSRKEDSALLKMCDYGSMIVC